MKSTYGILLIRQINNIILANNKQIYYVLLLKTEEKEQIPSNNRALLNNLAKTKCVRFINVHPVWWGERPSGSDKTDRPAFAQFLHYDSDNDAIAITQLVSKRPHLFVITLYLGPPPSKHRTRINLIETVYCVSFDL